MSFISSSAENLSIWGNVTLKFASFNCTPTCESIETMLSFISKVSCFYFDHFLILLIPLVWCGTSLCKCAVMEYKARHCIFGITVSVTVSGTFIFKILRCNLKIWLFLSDCIFYVCRHVLKLIKHHQNHSCIITYLFAFLFLGI